MAAKPTVVIAMSLEDDLKAQIAEQCEIREVDIRAPRAETLAALGDADGILLTPFTRVDAEFFDAGPNIRVVSTGSVGYDPIDVPEATRRGVLVCHTPGVLNAAVADLAMTMIFALSLKLFPYEQYVRSGGWARRDPTPGLGRDVRGKTLGVIGFGRIGQEVTRRMQGFDMRTLWYDVYTDPHPSAPASEFRPLDELLAESDFVSVHMNLNDASRHMIGAREFNLMKPTAYFINTARGPLVDQAALTAALQNGDIAGAALDVLEQEPPAEDDPIVQLPNVICFSHIGTATEETRRAMRELAVRNVINGVQGKRPEAPVNPEVLEA